MAVSAVVALGCGPIEYLSQVSSRAAGAVSAAKLAQADRYAPYELTAAEEYLSKAREEAGYAEYQDAIEYGRKSEELANRARAIAVSRMSGGRPPGAPTAAPKGRPGDSPRLPGADSEAAEGYVGPDDREPVKPSAAPARPAGGKRKAKQNP